MIGLSPPDGPLRVLCLGAHPDDVEIGCGATLLRLAAGRQLSAQVHLLTGTAERRAEARRATRLFLGEQAPAPTFAELPDGRLPAHWSEAKTSLQACAASTPPPDLVFAPRLDDAHQDHRVLAELVATVWRDSLVLHYEIPKWDGDLGTANTYVPVDEATARRKCELLTRSYPSQAARDWWDEETFLSLMRLRGVECRTRYAEAFVANKVTLAV